jgi:hypothetical protein
MNAYITTATTTQVYTGRAKLVIITVNAALTGTIKVLDDIAGTTANIATITNPTVGTSFAYYNFNTGVRIVTDASCDITVNVDTTRGIL